MKSKLNEIIKFLLYEPTIFSDYKISYKYPFLACEIFNLNSDIIFDYIYSETENEKPIIYILMSHLIAYSDFNEQSRDSTIPGYLERIIIKSIQNNSERFFKFLNIYYDDVKTLLINNIDSENIKEIIFQILTSSVNQVETEKLFSRDNILQFKLNFIREIYNLLQNSSELKEPKQRILNKISNGLYLLIKTLKFMFRINNDEIHLLLNEIINPNNLKIIENLLFEKSDLKMSDTSTSLSLEDIQCKIRLSLLFYFNLIETLLVKKENMIDSSYMAPITSSLFNEEVLTSISSTNGITNFDQQTSSSTDQLQNDQMEKVDKLEKNSTKYIPNLNSLISSSQEQQLISYFISIFQGIFETANRIKNMYGNLKIENANKSYTIRVSQEYLIFLDIFLILLSINEQSFTKYLESMLYIFHILIDDIIQRNSNDFLCNKILKIFQLIFKEEIYYCISFHLLQMENNKLMRILVGQIDIKNHLDIEWRKINSKNPSTNKAHLIKLIELYLNTLKDVEKHKMSSCICHDKMDVDSQNPNDQNIMIQRLYTDFDMKLSINEIDIQGVEEFLKNYNILTNTSLFAEQIQSQEELKNAGDEKIKSDKNCNFF